MCCLFFGVHEWFAGTKGAVTEAEYALADRAFLKFWGWLDEERPQIEGTDTGLITSTRVRCVDVGRKAAQLPGFNMAFHSKYSPSNAFELRKVTMDRIGWFVARIFSNLANITDWVWSGGGEWRAFGLISSEGSDLFQFASVLPYSFRFE